jgi:hypothetical protein
MQGIAEAEFAQFANGMGRQVDADADVTNVTRRFENFENDDIATPGGMKAECRRQPANPRACNDNRHHWLS